MHNTRAALAAGVFAAVLVTDFTGIRCPLGNGGHAFRVDFDWSGTAVNTTADDMQVMTLSGTLMVP